MTIYSLHLKWCFIVLLFFLFLATRFRLLKHTRLNVVAFLNELPKTQHDVASFNIDVNTYTVSDFHHASESLFLTWHLFLTFCPLFFLEHIAVIHGHRSV